MARIRTLKPEFFHSKKLAKCSPLARLLFAALMQLADREGRLRWIPMQVHAHAFPYESVDIAALVGELISIGSVSLYAVGHDEYLWLPRFTLHQRVKSNEAESRLPQPPDTSSDGAQCAPPVRTELTEVAPIGGVGIGKLEQGTGNREQGTNGASAPVLIPLGNYTRGDGPYEGQQAFPMASEALAQLQAPKPSDADRVWAAWREQNPTARKSPTAGQRKTIRARLKDYSVEELADYFRWLREAPHKRAVFCRTEGHDGFKSTMLPGNCDERMTWVAEWKADGAIKARPTEADGSARNYVQHSWLESALIIKAERERLAPDAVTVEMAKKHPQLGGMPEWAILEAVNKAREAVRG